MQKMAIVQMFDLKTRAWSTPHFVPSVPGWLRAVQDEVNNPSSQLDFAKHPEDFEAYHTGTWTDEGNNWEFENAESISKPGGGKFLTLLSDLVISKN